MPESAGFGSLTPEMRRALMARIRSKNTRPEMVVRRLAHSLGFRFRLHRRDLPGQPDLAFISRRKAVFVHGCFWHSHADCPLASTPRARPEYWLPKLEKNRRRDQHVRQILRQRGWDVLVIWECETRNLPRIAQILTGFLEP